LEIGNSIFEIEKSAEHKLGIRFRALECATRRMRDCFERRDFVLNKEASGIVVAEAIGVLDHLILGIADLNRGIEWMQEMTGVRAAIGGSHPGVGTRNALLSLGNRQYLEIMSIDPAQKQAGTWAVLVRDLTVPQLIMWAAATNDIAAIFHKAQDAGYEIDGPNAGSRVKPEGGILNWKTLNVINEFSAAIPFFIEWGAGMAHPSEDSPEGCGLQSLEMEHPEPDRVRKMLRALGVEVTVKRGSKARLRAVLRTPRGMVELS
jgi:hypothetical protein